MYVGSAQSLVEKSEEVGGKRKRRRRGEREGEIERERQMDRVIN
jgi:hypothetical protein